ncbi:MAG: hypothetical protein IT251_04670 [Chitinophagaceae bacterium]|nr:hypothetical protein [Chitinophagaceae bacterium]
MTTPRNAYPDKPVLAYSKTTISMEEVYKFLNELSNIPLEAKRTAAVMFRNESGNGTKGINNNYAGVQADGNRLSAEWDNRVAGTIVIEDSTGKTRRFVAFNTWQDSLLFTVKKVQARGVYIGATAKPYSNLKVDTLKNLSRAYYKEWVTGIGNSEPNADHNKTFEQLYKSVLNHINDNWFNSIYNQLKNLFYGN